MKKEYPAKKGEGRVVDLAQIFLFLIICSLTASGGLAYAATLTIFDAPGAVNGIFVARSNAIGSIPGITSTARKLHMASYER
jgi:hypothetical protein